jgi:hypothetical protein
MVDPRTAANDEEQDPAVLAQRLFEGYEDRRSDMTPGTDPVAADEREELLTVVRNLEAVTASLAATSEALAAIAATLAG